jgi:hypothetical protein
MDSTDFVKRNEKVAAPLRYQDNTLKIEHGKISDQARKAFETRIRTNMLGRTGLIFDVVEYRFDAPRGPHPPQSIKIACVSSPIHVEGTTSPQPGDLRLRRFRDGCALLERTDTLTPDQWTDLRRSELEAALDRKADIICFGELAYPAPAPVGEEGWSVEGLYASGAARQRFEDLAKEALNASDKTPFVFLGTFHCPLTLYNIGVIYPLGAKDAFARVRVRSEKLESKRRPVNKRLHKEVALPLLYRKRFPARRAGESLRVPPSEEFHVYDLPIGRIAVLICSDVVDINQALTIARRNGPSEKYDPIDFVLVPSFNESPKLASMCQELSYLARTSVVLVNANQGEGKFNDTTIYSCGLAVEELNKISPKLIVQSDVDELEEHGRKSFVTTFTLDNDALRDLRDMLGKIALERTIASDKISVARKSA